MGRLEGAGKRRRLQDLPLKIKLLSVTLLVVLIISVIAFFGFRQVVYRSNEMLYTQTATALGTVSDKVSAQLESIMDISLYIAVNKEFQQNLRIVNREEEITGIGRQARTDLFTHLYRSMQSQVISCTVFPADGSPLLWGSDSSSESPQVLGQAFEQAVQAQGAVVWVPSGRADGSLLCVREIRHIGLPFLDHLGYLVLRVDVGQIIEEAAGGLLSGQDYAISLSRGGEAFYPPAGQEPPLLMEQAHALYEIHPVQGERWFLTRSAVRADRVNWELVMGIPYGEMFRSLVIANAGFTLGLLAAGIAAVLLSHRMFSGINRHLQLLKLKMERVQVGNLEPFPTAERLGEDELGTLNRDFDRMTAEFKKVIEDNYVKELLLTQTQLKALEQQINPHFLYNSLESIHWFSRRGDGQSVSEIVRSLGRLLRSTLSENEDKIPLWRELDILDNYLNIQMLRFPDTLCVQVQAEEGAKAVLVPKMSVQPLVENAIVHSLEENIGVCHIAVRAGLVEGQLLVEVENDGSQIEDGILEKLRGRTVQTKGNGIGLINIDSRIKLLFGPGYGLTAHGEMDKTVVSFTIPASAAPQ